MLVNVYSLGFLSHLMSDSPYDFTKARLGNLGDILPQQLPRHGSQKHTSKYRKNYKQRG